jgi:hypothetical protein
VYGLKDGPVGGEEVETSFQPEGGNVGCLELGKRKRSDRYNYDPEVSQESESAWQKSK